MATIAHKGQVISSTDAMVRSFNRRIGSVMPITGDYTDNMVLLSSTMHIGGQTQGDVKQAIEALDNKKANQVLLASTMHIGGGTQSNSEDALNALNNQPTGHTVKNNAGTSVTQRNTLQFDGRLTAQDDSANQKTVVSMTDVWTTPVSCLIGDDDVTISNAAIHTTSTIVIFFENASGDPIAYSNATVTEGQIVITFAETLTEAASIKLQIIN